MPALLGAVLTNTPSVSQFVAHSKNARFSAAKVITAHGVDGGWNNENRGLLVRNFDKLVVRSKRGDPAYGGKAEFWLPEPEHTAEEARPWLALRPDMWFEPGNEPDVAWEHPAIGTHGDEMTIWKYNYWLGETIDRLRREFPRIKLIGPSPRIGVPGWQRWLEIMQHTLRACDSVSVHIYGWHKIVGDGKGELSAAQEVYGKLFPNKTIACTELGINDPSISHSRKLELYRDFARNAPKNWTWALAYHYDARREFHKEYAFLP